MFSALKKWAKGGNEDSKLSTPMGVRAMGQALQRKFARGIQYNMKIVIKGDRNTGKSCLFQRLQGRPFNEQYIPTNEIQVASIQWNYRTTDDIVKVEVWDVVDKGRSKKSSLSGLKFENDKIEGEKEGNVLDAEFVDVYKGAHGVLMTMDITKPWTFKYVERELPKVPAHIPVLVVANHRDMGEHRLIQKEEAVAFIDHLERPDRSPPVHYAETSMKNGFGLKYIHKFLNLPFLLLQRETLLKQLQVNAEDTESTLEELQIHKETEQQDYEQFVSLLDKRKKDHEAKKAAAAAAAAAAEGDGTPSSDSSGQTKAKSLNNSVSSDKNSNKDRKTPSATATEASQEEAPRNGLPHSSTNIDEFVPEDELDVRFLDEDKTGSRKRTNKPAAKKQPARVEEEPVVSEESDSDSDARNPMVAGFAEDIDSEDESAAPVITNHISEDLNRKQITKKPNVPTAAVAVELTSSEEDEKEDQSDEEEKGNEREKRERENERTKAIKEKEKEKETKKESAGLKLQMPVVSSSGMVLAVDGIDASTEDVDDWLNSPDSEPKIPFRTSSAVKLYTVRKVDTRSQESSSTSEPAIPVDEWDKFMISQMKPQNKTTTTTPTSLIDIGFDGDSGDASEENKSRKKKEHKSGEKSKSKHRQRKHRDKGAEGEEVEKKERRRSRHKEGDEGKDRRKSKDEEGDKKKKHRSKHSRVTKEEGVQEGVTYEEL